MITRRDRVLKQEAEENVLQIGGATALVSQARIENALQDLGRRPTIKTGGWALLFESAEVRVYEPNATVGA